MVATTIRPALGQPVTASGYMQRYMTPSVYEGEGHLRRCVFEPERGAWGWRRKRKAFEGVYVGTRRLKITWWWHQRVGYEDEDHKTKAAAYITVYMVAYSHTAAPRRVLPRDVFWWAGGD